MLPTSAENLNSKHLSLLPPEILGQANVLDLGCCIGATGHWVMMNGASTYLGLEHQPGFAEIAQELLLENPAAQVRIEDIETFLANPSRPQFDIVCALGIAHGLFDPLATIRRACNLTARYLCFEDFGVNQSVPALIAEPRMPMPLAGQSAGTIGFGWTFSPQVMTVIMGFLGFEADSTVTFIAENRWFCRYKRTRLEEAQSAAYSTERRSWT